MKLAICLIALLSSGAYADPIPYVPYDHMIKSNPGKTWPENPGNQDLNETLRAAKEQQWRSKKPHNCTEDYTYRAGNWSHLTCI
jgi:hypothetical protein